jgi:hypothetical protein
LYRKLDRPQSRSGYFGEAEKFLSPAGILGYAARSLVIVLKRRSIFSTCCPIAFGPFNQELCGMKTEFESFLVSLLKKALREI